jgi:hypothetical protein
MSVSDVKLRLVLASTTLTPDQIQSQTKVTPSQRWSAGELVHSRATNRRKENACVVEVVANGLSKAAAKLIEQLRGAKLTELTDVGVELSCIVNVRGSVPELHLDRDAVAFAASINAEIDFDVYV